MISPQFPEEVPSRVPERTLREFAGLCLVITGGLLGASWYRHQHAPSGAAWLAAALGVLVGVPGLIRPNIIRPVFLGAMALTKPIGHVVGLVLLAVVYFGVMTPLALAFRLAGRDGLGRYRWGAESYWVDHMPSKDVRHYLRQYQNQVTDNRVSSVEAPAMVPVQPVGPAIMVEFSSAQSPALPGVKHGSV